MIRKSRDTLQEQLSQKTLQVESYKGKIVTADKVRILKEKRVADAIELVMILVGNNAVQLAKAKRGVDRDEAVGMLRALDEFQRVTNNLITEGDNALKNQDRLKEEINELKQRI